MWKATLSRVWPDAVWSWTKTYQSSRKLCSSRNFKRRRRSESCSRLALKERRRRRSRIISTYIRLCHYYFHLRLSNMAVPCETCACVRLKRAERFVHLISQNVYRTVYNEMRYTARKGVFRIFAVPVAKFAKGEFESFPGDLKNSIRWPNFFQVTRSNSFLRDSIRGKR